MSYAGTNAAFAGNTVSTFDGTRGIILQQIHHAGKSNKQAQSYAFSHANRSSIPFVEYPSKPIILIGKIVGNSIADCDGLIDYFNSLFTTQDGNLDFDYNGGSLNRRYIATATNIDVQRPDGLADATFNVLMTATIAFGRDTTTTNLLNQTNQSAGFNQYAVSLNGTAPYQVPTFTLTISALTMGGTNLVSNGTFESGTTGWSSSVGTMSQSSTYAHTGTYSLKMVNAATATNGVYGWEYMFLSGLTAGQSYIAQAWVKGNAGGESVTINVPGGGQQTITLTTSWQLITIGFTAQSTSAELDFWSTGPANATWFLDDVSVTPNASATVGIGNDATGQQINVTRVWSPGDILTIDCSLSTNTPVLVNGSPVDFTGAFPAFFTPNPGGGGSGTVDYYDTFTTRTFNLSASYYAYWL